MELVNKAAVVAEIERLISNGKFKCQQSQENGDQKSYIAWSEHIATCGKILSFLKTLEVKEVDLEKEIDNQIQLLCGVHTMEGGTNWYKGPYSELIVFAEHFFELGLAQKGE